MKRWTETLPLVHKIETPVHKIETPVHERDILDRRIRYALWSLRDQVLMHGSDLDAALFKLSLQDLRLLAIDAEEMCRTLGVKP